MNYYDCIKITIHNQGLVLDSSIKVKVVNAIKRNTELCEMIQRCTSHVSELTTLKARLVLIRDNITETPICGNCGIEVPITTSGVKAYTYPPFCSRVCASSDITTRSKVLSTNIKLYGVDNVFKSPKHKQKIKNKMNELYGVDSPLQSEQLKKKMQDTMVDRHGVSNPAHSITLQLKKQATNNTLYGVDNVFANKTIQQKIKDTNITRYGSIHPNQRNLSVDTLDKLYDNDWLHDQYYYTSLGERDIGDFIRSEGVTIECGIRTIISPYELDIYIPEHKLAIEYCGLYWHSEIKGKDRHYHKRKHTMCKELGIQLITIFEDEWKQHPQQVKQKIKHLLGIRDKDVVYARKTSVVLIDKLTKREFFDVNHIQGDGPSSINIGLEVDGEVVAVMGFKKDKDQHYLNRYATSCSVVGGFSKLLKHFTANYQYNNIISFADLRWSDGGLYEKNGWLLDGELKPDYSYSPDGNTRHHKFGYRRGSLEKKLKHYDPNLSERVNCDNNGVLRIWDCGKLRYKYR